MITRIREVRKAKGLALHEVAAACVPPTTAQTIGRLETGMRTVSVGWLNRIADALGVPPSELVTLPGRVDVPVAALLRPEGAVAPTTPRAHLPPLATGAMIGVAVEASTGEYRAGDDIWAEQAGPDGYADAMHRDVLVPRAGGGFVWGRLIAVEGGTVRVLPGGSGARPVVVKDAPWIAVARTLVRPL